MNRITATGRLAADAEVKYTQGGDAIAEFRLASDVGFGEKKTTNWFRCSVFGKRAEPLAPHLVKGTPVTVFGTLTLREWTNREGVKQLSPEIRIDEIELQGGKSDKPQQRQESRPAAKSQPFDDMADDVPFN